MKRKVLVPTDFSETAQNALRYAIKMYKNEPCDFYLLNSFSVNSFTLDSLMIPEPGEKTYDLAATKSKNGLSKTVVKLDSKYNSTEHHFHQISKFATPLVAIEVLVEEMDIEMIVMGTNGAGKRRDKIYGSNTVITMEKITNCPVLAIPREAKFPPTNEIVFVTDFSIPYKKNELLSLKEITHKSEVPLRILHISNNMSISEKQYKNRDKLPKYFEGIDYSFHTLNSNNIEESVHFFSDSRNSGMIIFMNRQNSFLKRIFSTSMAKKLGSYTKVPIMALHDLHT
ncbi:universal stress protein [uncultured Polaribacter sp.]|uniref:universal stress protein n=1 Tax=uncultured Polaribacter sp. TaxID=174711 RepID=UPI00260E2CE3|nr:universal stress protein [uncultured Polaribacter sp.]